jgi:23S rRNA (cytosine1962-C5)-methyltransferase
LPEGSIVEVCDHENRVLATGHYHKGTITVRCFHFGPLQELQGLISEKIKNAIQLRQCLIASDSTNCFRLIHGEGDGLPGLIVDIYDSIAVIQSHTLGMYNLKQMVAEEIRRHLPFIKAIYDKSVETLSRHGFKNASDGYLDKAQDFIHPDFVIENGYKFILDIEQGQKTGFFLDQRENRKLLGDVSSDKTVLNTFCYSGGFSVYALGSNAKEVHSVDSSKRAIELTERNIELNFPGAPHTAFRMDVMEFLRTKAEMYDIVILDPPAYAKHLNQVKNAMVGYRNLNTEGLRHVKPGGLLFTFSCSQAVDTELFRKIIFQSGLQSGRELKIVHHLSQPADHPVSIYHPEAEYLKGFVLYVS